MSGSRPLDVGSNPTIPIFLSPQYAQRVVYCWQETYKDANNTITLKYDNHFLVVMKTVCFIFVSILLLSSLALAVPEQKLFHDITIHQMLIPEQSLHCNKEILFLVDLQNKGTFSEDISLELVNKELQVHAFSPTLTLIAGTSKQLYFPLFFIEEPQGTFTFDAYLHTEQGIKQSLETFTFTGCKTIHLTSVIQEQQPFSLPQQTLPPQKEEKKPVDLLLVGTLFLFGTLFILGSFALLRLF